MFCKTTTAIVLFIACFLAMVNAIVINPKITVPSQGTKWRAGETFTVKWATTFYDGEKTVPIPDDYKGTIKLGYYENGNPSMNLKWDLASGFQLNSGAQSVTLPSDLDTKTSYIVVLMGDSGNASPKFTIRAARGNSSDKKD
ncbi:hypothetical protein BDF20DRAFT_874497 [Mycotypha africana]|uniref:uncharacterized protein n=1 Tax=Mycotypha africana TaxID=64632 RepID=UPI0023015682|nr:uncharacterized protein BDF20DRAFT_874497 [Mycotypha africana]KAI8977385.1 hypothetical protein BDF20DRAFT_874497 [Mycotypha africana]